MIKNLKTGKGKLPYLGHIRLGIKKMSQSGAAYPSEIDYFILDPIEQGKVRQKVLNEFYALYGEKPKALDIMFPLVEGEQIFEEWYKRYNAGGLKCKGDGEVASCYKNEVGGMKVISEREDELVNIECRGPQCRWQQQEHPQCLRVGTLQVLLPEISGIGVWQINTSSVNSIKNIEAAIEWLRRTLGEYRLLPLRLNRVPIWTVYNQRRSMHYVLTISNDKKLSELQEISRQNVEKINNKAALIKIESVEEESIEEESVEGESEIEPVTKEELVGNLITEDLGNAEVVTPEIVIPKQRVSTPMPIKATVEVTLKQAKADIPQAPVMEVVKDQADMPQQKINKPMALKATVEATPKAIPRQADILQADVSKVPVVEVVEGQADILQADIPQAPIVKPPTTLATKAQIRAIYSILSQWGVKGDAEKHQRFNGWLKKHFDREVKSFTEITGREVSTFIQYVNDWTKKHKQTEGDTTNG